MSAISGAGFKGRLGLAILEVAAIFALLYYALGWRDYVAIGSVAAALALSTLVPPKWSGVVSGVCLFGLAALFYVRMGAERLAIVLAAFGAVQLLIGIVRLRTKR